VYAIEREPVAVLARSVIDRSPFRDRIEVVRCSVEAAQLPEQADVAITETVGTLGLDEGIGYVLRAARARHLKPGAREIPRQLRLRAVPVELPPWLGETFGLDSVEGFDLRPVFDGAANRILKPMLHDLRPESSAGPPRQIWSRAASDSHEFGATTVNLPVQRCARVSALALLLGVDLTDRVSLNLALGERSNWGCGLLALRPEFDVHPGDQLETTVVAGQRSIQSWRVRQLRGANTLAEQSHVLGDPGAAS
jgi:hypothetical protein